MSSFSQDLPPRLAALELDTAFTELRGFFIELHQDTPALLQLLSDKDGSSGDEVDTVFLEKMTTSIALICQFIPDLRTCTAHGTGIDLGAADYFNQMGQIINIISEAKSHPGEIDLPEEKARRRFLKCWADRLHLHALRELTARIGRTIETKEFEQETHVTIEVMIGDLEREARRNYETRHAILWGGLWAFYSDTASTIFDGRYKATPEDRSNLALLEGLSSGLSDRVEQLLKSPSEQGHSGEDPENVKDEDGSDTSEMQVSFEKLYEHTEYLETMGNKVSAAAESVRLETIRDWQLSGEPYLPKARFFAGEDL